MRGHEVAGLTDFVQVNPTRHFKTKDEGPLGG